MFGFQGGESAAIVARKRIYMKDAQQRWAFMTNYDSSTIRNELQLVALVKDRTGKSFQEAQADVDAWLVAKEF
jgi:hypothetical protein